MTGAPRHGSQGSRRPRWSRAFITVVAALVVTLGAGSAQAYWTPTSLPGGSTTAAATTVGAGARPTGVPTGGSVALSWAASTLGSGQAVSGYTVIRYSAGNVPQTVGGTCSGLVAATTCTETGVPTGTWTYTITPRFATNWTGAESPKSSNVVVDATPPTNAITLSGVTGAAVLSGTTVYYRGVAAGSFALRNAVADAETGPASSATAALTGTTTGWTHTPSTVSTPAGGPYVSSAFSWAAGTTSSPGEVVTGRDVAGNTATTSLTFVNDSTGPSGGTVDAVGLVGTGARYSISTSLSIAFTAGSDPTGVVLTAARLYRATATLTSTAGADGVCGTYGAYAAVGVVNPVSPYANTVPTAQRCYRYQYVVADGFGNSTTYTSGDIKVDTTVPSRPTLAFSGFTNTYWSGTGTTVYYRSNAASGAFTVTAASTDADSGIASFAFPALGTNWTSTPGALGVNTYSWTGAPAAPGTRNVTATNNASRTSTTTSFTMTADITAPSAGSVTYVNGSTGGGTVSVTFTTGTDGGSGLGTRLLQRADAPLTGLTCGTYGAFATVVGGTNPASPLVDTVATSGFCYKYQYVVSDNVGNTQTSTSANVAHTPYGAWWTFNEGAGTSAADSFGNANTGTLQATAGWTTGKIGASALNLTGAATSWADVANPLPTSLPVIDSSQSYTVATWVKLNNLTGFQTFASIDGTNVSPFYLQMSGGIFAFSQRGSDSTASTVAQVNGLAPTAGTWYYVVGVYDKTANRIQLYVNGVSQGTATATTAWQATGHTVVGRAKWAGASVDFVNGSLDETRFFDRALTASEIVALGGYSSAVGATPGLVNYWQLGEATVVTGMVDNKGAANGTYVGTPTLGVAPGIITNDSNTAVTFDGATQYATATRQITNDFSIEFWFRSTQGIGTGAQWWQGAGLVDADVSTAGSDFGTSLRSDGRVVAGTGEPDISIVSSTAGFNDGNWHHVVFTRVGASGAMVLYVDGASQGTATGGSAAALTTPTIYFGRVGSGGYLAGSLDEVATYSVVLSPATVAAHYAAR